MEALDIENLESLLGNRRIISRSITKEYDGGVFLDVELEDEDNLDTEKYHVVVRRVPGNFSKSDTEKFAKELDFYTMVMPTLINFQKSCQQKPIECLSKFIAGRANIHNDKGDIDEHAVILLERSSDLKHRQEYLDFNTSKLILNSLAKFHATAIALKLRRPDIFMKKIHPCLKELRSLFVPLMNRKKLSNSIAHMVKYVKEISPIIPYLKESLEKICQNFQENYKTPYHKEPWSCIIHTNLTHDNIISDGKSANKIINWYQYEYGSPTKDVIFFIFTAVEVEVLNERFNDLLKYYQETFAKTLEELNCDVRDFSFRNFEKELAANLKRYELIHVLLTLERNLLELKGDPDEEAFTPVEVEDDIHERIIFIIRECLRRRWI